MEPIGASRTLSADDRHTGVDDHRTDPVGPAGGEPATPSWTPDGDQPPPRPPGPSTHLALIVLGIAAGLMVLGAVASGLTASQGAPRTVPKSTPTAKGSPLKAQAAAPALSSITSAGLPPEDVLEALALPDGTKVVTGSATNPGVGLYDRSLSFVVPTSEQKVIEFFRAELPFDLWHVVSQGPASHGSGFQVIAQHPASDGYEWELGVTVMAETFVGSSSAGSAQSGDTPFTVRLFEVGDEQ